MTKQEAIEQMKLGNKVTHRYFGSKEWITMERNSILLEDGVRCSVHEFWKYRTGDGFENDWELFKE